MYQMKFLIVLLAIAVCVANLGNAMKIQTCKEDKECKYSPGQCCAKMWGHNDQGEEFDIQTCFSEHVIRDNKGWIKY